MAARKRILLAAPVRDRGWVLPAYLDRVAALTVPAGVELDCYFLPNGPDPQGCEAMLERFRDLMAGRLHVEVGSWPEEPPVTSTRETQNRTQIYPYLARLRNALVEKALAGGYDYLFSVDCDLMLPEDALVRLLAAEKDVVAATLCNDEFWSLPKRLRVHNVMRRAPFPATSGGPAYEHIRGLPDEGLLEVDITGACFLIRRSVLEAGARFGDHPFGEDVPFCEQVQALGFKLFADAGLRLDHIMGQHTWVTPGVLQAVPKAVPFFVQIPSADKRRMDVLLSRPAMQGVTGRVMVRLILEQLQREGHGVLDGMTAVESYEWDQGGETLFVRLEEPTPQPAAIAPQPIEQTRPNPRRGMVAGQRHR